MKSLDSNMSKFLPLCPFCGGYTFSQHWMSEYSRDWNKCPSCGYMEEKKTSINRILNKLSPDKLTEPFIDPVTPEVIKKISSIVVGRTYNNSEYDSTNDIKSANNKGEIDDIP